MHALILALTLGQFTVDATSPGFVVVADHKHHEKPSPKPTGGEHRCPNCAADLQVMQDEIHALKGRLTAVEAELSNVKATQGTASVPAKVAPAKVAPVPGPSSFVPRRFDPPMPVYRPMAQTPTYTTDPQVCKPGQPCGVQGQTYYPVRTGPLRRLFGR